MSLHTVAKHVAAKGRGPDTQLVHMTPKEVQGLQALAMAHGGSLTINPETGLVEAGVLSRLLPTILGAALTATGIGAPMAGLLVGGGKALATGDLKQGLMAGLGAFGGYGLAGGISDMGMQAAGEKAGAEALGTTPEAMATEAGSQQALQTTIPPDYYAAGEPGTTFFDPAKAQAYSAEYAKAAQPSLANTGEGLRLATENPSAYVDKLGGGMKAAQYGLAAAAPSVPEPAKLPTEEKYSGPLSKFQFDPSRYTAYEPQTPNPYYTAQYQQYASGGTIEQMSNANAVGANTGYPTADIQQGAYATPWQTPVSRNVIGDASDTGVDTFTGQPRGMASGGISSLGSYSDGGRMLKGPGDGMSDSIPAQIGGKQPARLADGEFVVPADVVSHLGNGSTDAGAKQLYKMMDRIRQQRTGKKKQAPEVNPAKAMPA